MSPEQIEQIVSSAIKEGLEFPWWLYLSAVVTAFVGGFLGAYLKRKGENLATREDYESLLQQVKRTTQETESIKMELAKGSWLHQQSWYLKEKYYSGLLENLYKLRLSISDRLNYYVVPESEYHDEQVNKSEHYKKQTEIGIESLQNIQRLHGPAEKVITKKAIEALMQFYSADWHAGDFSTCNKEYLDDAHQSVNDVYQTVLQEAQLELK